MQKTRASSVALAGKQQAIQNLSPSQELERLLSYEMDAKTGEPKFIESQRALQELDQSGALEDLRDRAERGQADSDPTLPSALTQHTANT